MKGFRFDSKSGEEVQMDLWSMRFHLYRIEGLIREFESFAHESALRLTSKMLEYDSKNNLESSAEYYKKSFQDQRDSDILKTSLFYRTSTLVQIYVYLEFRIRELIKCFNRYPTISICFTQRALNDNYLELLREFYKKNLKSTFSESLDYTLLKEQQQVRNLCIHQNCNINNLDLSKREKIKNIISKSKGLNLSNEGVLEICDCRYLINLIGATESFLTTLYSIEEGYKGKHKIYS
jgi:hypothetical protein